MTMKHQVKKHQKLKKIRGKKRKAKNLCLRIADRTKDFPLTGLYDLGYFNYKLPAYQGFIDCCYEPTDIRNQVCQALIDATDNLIATKPVHLEHTKVVLLLTLPNIFYASINVFFDPDYYTNFFNRSSHYQSWTHMDLLGSQTAKYKLNIPKNLSSKLIQETINDEDYSGSSEIYLIGEIPE
ncbi:MAG: DUF3916 domain-containing protein [Candidatus Cloacimonetes bacterium]|nr:DUF3916 domain-containing protein [Candidatus Cloacimonadota bacterium]